MISRRALFLAATPGFFIAARAEAFLPEGNVRILTPVPPGGSPDLAARLLADKLSAKWNRVVLVDNRPGADGIIAVTALLESKDQFTLLLAPSGMLTVTPLLRDVPFDPQKDLRPISMIAADYLAIVVPEASPIRSLKALSEAAKLNPGSLNWFAAAGAPMLAFEAFVRRNQLQSTYVPYKGGPDALRDLVESRIGAAVVPLAVARPLVAAGRLRIVAVTNQERAPGFAEVPTAAESGYPELAVEGMLGLLGSKSMSKVLAQRISEDVLSVLSDPVVRAGLLNSGLLAKGSTPDDYEHYLTGQRAYWNSEAAMQRTKN